MSGDTLARSEREQLRSRLYGQYATFTYPDQAVHPPRPVVAHFSGHLMPHIPLDRDAVIVDIGCGAGSFLHFLRELGYRNVFGVDISPEQVALAREAGLECVEEGEAVDYLTVRQCSFDVVVAIDVIEHLTRFEAVKFLGAARDALRPGGRVVLHTLNASAPFFGRIRYGDITHETAFNRVSLDQVFRAVGLVPVGFTPTHPTGRFPLRVFRRAIVALYQTLFRLYLAAETGVVHGHILSESIIAVALRPESPEGR